MNCQGIVHNNSAALSKIVTELKKNFLKKNVIWVFGMALYLATVFLGFWALDKVVYPVLALMLMAAVGLSKKKALVRIRLIDCALLLLYAYEIINYLCSSYQPNSFSFFFKLTLVLVCYILWVVLANKLKIEKFMLLAVVNYGGILALGTMLQFILFYTQLDRHGLIGVHHFKSVFGPFGTAVNDWATVMLLFFVPCCYLVVILWKNSALKYLLLVNGTVLFMAMLVSFSRGIYIAIFFFLSCLIFLFVRHAKRQPKQIFVPLFLMVCGILFAMFPVRESIMTTLKMSETTSQVRSTKGRLGLWGRGFEMVKEYPILGAGSDNFALRFPGNSIERTEDDTLVLSRVNNTLLQILIDKGFMGLVIYAFVLYALLECLLRLFAGKSTNVKDKLFARIFLFGIFAFLMKELTFTSLLTSDSVLVLIILWAALIRKYSPKVVGGKVSPRLSYIMMAVVSLYLAGVVHQQNSFKIAESKNGDFVTAMAQHKLREAANDIAEAIRKKPSHAIYHLNKGVMLMSSSKVPFSVIDILDRSVDSFAITNKWKYASEEFEKVLELHPNDELATYYLGWLSFYKGELPKAKTYFNRSYEKDHCEPLYNLSKALLHYHLNEISEAVFHFKKAVSISPNILDGNFWREIRKRPLLSEKKMLTQISMELRESYEVSKSPIVGARLAKVLQYMNFKKESRKLYQSVTQEIPNLNRPWIGLAETSSTDDYKTRERMYKKAEFLDHEDYLPKLKLALFYEDNGKYEEALFYYKKALPELFKAGLGLFQKKAEKGYHVKTPLQLFFPQELRHLSVPYSDPKLFCYRMSDLYRKMNNNARADEFQRLGKQLEVPQHEIEALLY